jgi:hypothetical protein
MMDVLFVHGYSETSLGAYFTMPARLQAAVPGVGRIVLAAFDTLDDTVTIDDLADAMETRVHAIEAASQFTVAGAAVICHSTGALVARRWLLNRLAAGTQIPSYLITMAGANHGSSLAQMGKSVLGYVQKLLLKHLPTVGAAVLTDLDYGSDFLLRLNREWLERWNDGSLDGLFAFSMGGDYVGSDSAMQVFWQTHEPGSDNTVRISGANLNYTMIDVVHGPTGPQVVATRPDRPIPHRVLAGYSHFGPDTGILGWVQPAPPGDVALAALVDALSVTDAASYAAAAQRWSADLANWMTVQRAAIASNPNAPCNVNSTAVFTIVDESERSITDCVIAFLNQQQLGTPDNTADPSGAANLTAATNAVSSAIQPHSPIQNNTELGSYSFYVRYDEYLKTSPHWFYIEAALPTDLIAFTPLRFTQPPELDHTIQPNEFTYARLTMSRDATATYAMYGFTATLNLPGTTWMPFPGPGRLAP